MSYCWLYPGVRIRWVSVEWGFTVCRSLLQLNILPEYRAWPEIVMFSG